MSRVQLSRFVCLIAIAACLHSPQMPLYGQVPQNQTGEITAVSEKEAAEVPRVVGTFDGPSDSINQVRFSHDNKEIAAVSDDPGLWVWNVATKKLKFGVGVSESPREVRFSPTGELIAVCGADGPRFYDSDSGELKTDFSPNLEGRLLNRKCHTFVFSSDQKKAYFGAHNDLLCVELDEFKNGEMKERKLEFGTIRGMTLTKDGKRLLTSHSGGTAIVWDAKELSELSRFSQHTDKVYDVDITPDGKFAVTSSRDTTVFMWNTKTGDSIKKFVGHKRGVKSVAFTPDASAVITGSYDDTVRLWDVATGKEIWKMDCSGANHVAVSSNGRYLACGGGYISRTNKIPIESYAVTLFELPKKYHVKD